MRRLKFILTFFLFGYGVVGFSQAEYQLIIDNTKSSIIGAENILTVSRALSDFQDRFLVPKFTEEKNWKTKTVGVGYRLGKTVLLDNIWNDFVRVFQHEVFGHGYRLRELKYSKTRYSVSFPAPIYGGGGLTYFGFTDPDRMYSHQESIFKWGGGSESNTILANAIRDKWFNSGQIFYREAYLYITSFHNITRYIKNTKKEPFHGVNDIQSYLLHVGYEYGYSYETSPLTLEKLKKKAWINLANPVQYLALYTLLYEYIWKGNTHVKMPMINIGEYQYLPIVRMGLNPFGPETFFENIIRSDRAVNVFYVRVGSKIFEKNYGIGFSTSNLLTFKRVRVKARLDLWDQPPMELGGDEITQYEERFGGLLNLGFDFKLINSEDPLNIYTLIGYKTPGYVEGEILDKGMILRVGVTMMMN